MTEKQITARLKTMLDKPRFQHSLRVKETAAALAKRYGADVDKAERAGLVHDCAKGISGPDLLKLCDQFGIVLDSVKREEPEILHAYVGGRAGKTGVWYR